MVTSDDTLFSDHNVRQRVTEISTAGTQYGAQRLMAGQRNNQNKETEFKIFANFSCERLKNAISDSKH